MRLALNSIAGLAALAAAGCLTPAQAQGPLGVNPGSPFADRPYGSGGGHYGGHYRHYRGYDRDWGYYGSPRYYRRHPRRGYYGGFYPYRYRYYDYY